MKKTLFIVIILLFTATPALHSGNDPQMAIIKDVRGEIFDDSAQIIVEANCNIDYIDYTIPNPQRLIVDPVGKVYSDLKEVINFDSGPVKKVTIVKGKPEEGLTGSYYPLDFISIELVESPDYKIRKDVKEEVIVDIIGKSLPQPVATAVTVPIEEEETAVEPPPVKLEVTEEPKEAKTEEEAIALPEVRVGAPAPQLPQPLPPETPIAPSATEITPLEEVTVPSVPAMPEPAKAGYHIGEGDTLDISVWQHPELDRRVVVRPDGYISFSLVGDIKAATLTPPQLASGITGGLSKLLKDPNVTVIVANFGSKNIFVLGEVDKPGVYQFRGGINILEAISLAGGWKNSAVLNSVMLVRRVFTDQPEGYRLNVYNIIKRGDFSQNMTLEPGDVIYVPKSFVANIGGFIENLRITVGAYVTNSSNIFN